MDILELVKELALWEDELNRYKQTFKTNNDKENYEEVKKFLDTIDEFINIYNTTKTYQDERRYYSAVKYWMESNKKYMKLLENLYKAYENRNEFLKRYK